MIKKYTISSTNHSRASELKEMWGKNKLAKFTHIAGMKDYIDTASRFYAQCPAVCWLCESSYMILHIRPITRKSAVPHHASVLAASTCNVEYLSMPCAMMGWDISETWRGGFAVKRAPESIRFQAIAPMTSLRLID